MLNTDKTVLSVEDFSIPSNRFNKLSFEIKEKEIVGIVNETLGIAVLRSLIGLEEATGKCFLEGNDISQVPIHDRVRKGMSFMPSGGECFQTLTVKEHLDVATWPIPIERRSNRLLEETAEKFGLDLFLEEKPKALNSAQKIALVFAMMYIQESRVILFENPLAGLERDEDKVAAIEFLKNTAKILKEERNGALLLTGQAVEIADRIIEL